MPTGWTARDERQFERVKASYLTRGRSPRKTAELAARLVNKQRRERGETQEGPVTKWHGSDTPSPARSTSRER